MKDVTATADDGGDKDETEVGDHHLQKLTHN